MSKTFSFNPEVARRVHDEYRWVLSQEQSHETRYFTNDSPSAEHIRCLIEEAFWASLERIEGRHHRFWIALCPKDSVVEPLVFSSELPFDSEHLAKLSPAVQAEMTLIGVWLDNTGNLKIWGFCPAQMGERFLARQLDEKVRPLVKVVDAGQIVFEFGGFSGYFRQLITGTTAEPLELYADPLLNALAWTAGTGPEEMQRYIEFRDMAIQMRSHGHGGTLLVVPADDEGWRPSVDCGANSIEPHNRSRHRSVTEFIAQLTAVDGAAVVTYDLTVHAFGAKIKELKERPTKVIERFICKDRRRAEKDVSAFGFGMRHLSALQFISQNPKAIALVVSQDGGLSIIERRSGEKWVSITRHAEFVLL